jgi:Zn-dependent protease with chaperone function/uncharacterized RDD family membrane protein YckC
MARTSLHSVAPEPAAPPGPRPSGAAERLFAKPDSLRVRGEQGALWRCIIFAPAVIGLAGLVFPSLSVSEFVLLIVGGMVFVSISRGRLLGSSIRIEGRQLPEIAEVADEVAARLGMPTPQIFVRDDPFVPISAVGVGEPYAIIISSQYYEHLRRGELAFLIARELAHIAAGHTRLTSLLSASGRENPIVSLVFGDWLRRTEYTADRVGLICCGDLDAARGAISITTFHSIGRRVDMHVLAEQRRELQAEPALRMGEWTASVPFATNRLDALTLFAASPLAAAWRARLAEPARGAEVAPLHPDAVARRELAPLRSRFGALLVDFAIILAILKTPLGLEASKDVEIRASSPDLAQVPEFLRSLVAHSHLEIVHLGSGTFGAILTLFAYSAILVALSGQTLGMMVMELRVVTTRYGRPTILQSFWRYAVALFSSMTAIALLGFLTRVHPHDRLSRTRLIRGRKTA